MGRAGPGRLPGEIGLPGGGFATGYGSMGSYGGGFTPRALPRLPQGRNPVDTLIPVARIADMLLCPGEPFDFNGQRLRYPEIHLVYWAGGNPFHHHQDLARLRRAFARPDTVVVHETHWTATARHADVVLPVTTSLEREDFAASRGDLRLRVMRRAVPPHGAARDEYAIFTGLAERLGTVEEFTEGRDVRQWLRHLYEEWRERQGPEVELPDFDRFWADGGVDIPHRVMDTTFFGAFRADPQAHPLGTPSGRIELYSETIAGFGYPDCPGHPTWLDPPERPGTPRAQQWPLVLVANQPKDRLHSQQDMGAHSRAGKIADRAPVRLTRTTRLRAASPTAMWYACSTTGAPAWRAPYWTTGCGRVWCSCPRVPGSTRPRRTRRGRVKPRTTPPHPARHPSSVRHRQAVVEQAYHRIAVGDAARSCVRVGTGGHDARSYLPGCGHPCPAGCAASLAGWRPRRAATAGRAASPAARAGPATSDPPGDVSNPADPSAEYSSMRPLACSQRMRLRVGTESTRKMWYPSRGRMSTPPSAQKRWKLGHSTSGPCRSRHSSKSAEPLPDVSALP